MPNANFAGAFLNKFIDVQQKEKDRKAQNTRDSINFLISTGRVRDYNDLMPLIESLNPQAGQLGKKPTGGKGGQLDVHSVLGQFLNPAFKMAQESKTMGGQTRPSFQAPPPAPPSPSLLMHEDEFQAREDQVAAHKEALAIDLDRQRQKAEEDRQIAVDRARADTKPQPKGTPDKQPHQNLDGTWSLTVRDAQGNRLYDQPAQAPKATGALAERKQELIAKGIPEDRAGFVAATQLEGERGTKQQQASTRLGAYLAMSRQALASNTLRYEEMKQTFPYTLAAKMSGAEVAAMRPEVVRMTLARGQAALDKPTAADKDAQKEASKIVEAATKTAATLAGKENTILKGLGIDDDEATIRRNLIQEMSGGQDPDQVEALAITRLVTPPAPKSAMTPATVNTPRGTWTVTPIP